MAQQALHRSQLQQRKLISATLKSRGWIRGFGRNIRINGGGNIKICNILCKDRNKISSTRLWILFVFEWIEIERITD